MAKIADVFGRFEAFCISVFIYTLGYAQMAASKNVQTYASAQIFYSAGSTGLQILQQVFIADSSDLLNRALFASLPDLPFLVTVWVGPMIASWILRDLTWRWGYGMWVVILPAAFMPLALSLWINQRKARRLHLLKPKSWKGKGFRSLVRSTWYELDLFGLLLLSAGLILILVPLTLAANAKGAWHNGSIIAMIIVGCICLVLCPLWETSKTLAPHPLLSLKLLRQRTVLAGCAFAFFYFSKCLRPSSSVLSFDNPKWHFIFRFSLTYTPISKSFKGNLSLPLVVSRKLSLSHQLSPLSPCHFLSNILEDIVHS